MLFEPRVAIHFYCIELVIGVRCKSRNSATERENYMATTNEIWICEGVEGAPRRQQMARLGEWKKLFLAEGAKDVKVWEGGYGEFNGTWFFAIEFDNAQAFGASLDKFHANSKSFDDAMDVWSKTPALKFKSGGLLHHMASI